MVYIRTHTAQMAPSEDAFEALEKYLSMCPKAHKWF